MSPLAQFEMVYQINLTQLKLYTARKSLITLFFFNNIYTLASTMRD